MEGEMNLPIDSEASTDQRLRQAADIMAAFFSSVLSSDPTRRFLYSHEECALQWLREQWKRDPETIFNAWTADYVHGSKTIENRSADGCSTGSQADMLNLDEIANSLRADTEFSETGWIEGPTTEPSIIVDVAHILAILDDREALKARVAGLTKDEKIPVLLTRNDWEEVLSRLASYAGEFDCHRDDTAESGRLSGLIENQIELCQRETPSK